MGYQGGGSGYGMGAVVMDPGRDYGAWGYGAGQTPYGSPGFGIYGLGDHVFSPYKPWRGGYGSPGYGQYPTRAGSYLYGLGQNGNGTPTAGAGAEVEGTYRAAFDFGVPVVTGLVGAGIGFALGWMLRG